VTVWVWVSVWVTVLGGTVVVVVVVVGVVVVVVVVVGGVVVVVAGAVVASAVDGGTVTVSVCPGTGATDCGESSLEVVDVDVVVSVVLDASSDIDVNA
jgi:hypothetical protein